MKYLIFSDLHGSAESAEILITKFKEYACDAIICLGDVLYHGPRNDLPSYYNPKRVIELLNPYANQILCIRGNCDAEVDEMVLKFPIVPFKDVMLNGIGFHLEHGHHLDEVNTKEKVILFGHTHIPLMERRSGHIYMNPGSITIPKAGSKRSYIILQDQTACLYDIDDHVLLSFSLKE